MHALGCESNVVQLSNSGGYDRKPTNQYVEQNVNYEEPIIIDNQDEIVQNPIEEPIVAPVEEPVTAPVVETPAVSVEPSDDEVKVEAVGGQSFVDSIVADVSDILDDKTVVAPKTDDDGEDYKQLYHDELEKTIELEKELKELHSKLNNIKNIVE